MNETLGIIVALVAVVGTFISCTVYVVSSITELRTVVIGVDSANGLRGEVREMKREIEQIRELKHTVANLAKRLERIDDA